MTIGNIYMIINLIRFNLIFAVTCVKANLPMDPNLDWIRPMQTMPNMEEIRIPFTYASILS